MRKSIIAIIILGLIIPCFGSIDKPRTKKEFEQKIEHLEARIHGLETLVKAKNAEINRLKRALETAQKIPLKPDRVTETNLPAGVIKQPIFGVYLGESLNSLRKRKTIGPSDYTYPDKDHPGQIWNVENTNTNVKALRVSIYQGMIYEIAIDFADASQTNYDVIKKQLQEKYRDKGDEGLTETLFSKITLQPIVDGIRLLIILDYDENAFGDNTLTLRYTHCPIVEKVRDEIKRRKAAKVSGQL